MNQANYKIKVICANCDALQEEKVEIPKGTPAKEYLEGKVCDTCGVAELQPIFGVN